MLAQMTVRDVAYCETYEWLENGRSDPPPQPPEGMHPLALAEWVAGHEAANVAFDEAEAWVDRVERIVVKLFKAGIVVALFLTGWGIGTWWSMSGTGVLALIFSFKYIWNGKDDNGKR